MNSRYSICGSLCELSVCFPRRCGWILMRLLLRTRSGSIQRDRPIGRFVIERALAVVRGDRRSGARSIAGCSKRF